MKSGQSHPTFEQVREDIGDKVITAIGKCVASARRDLSDYREALPRMVARHTDRGLANWIHDMMWASLVTELDEMPGVDLVDNNVTREVVCGVNYRFRVKRHDRDARVRSYPTQSALDFHIQTATLDGLEEWNLTFGYEWDNEQRRIGSPVMALHNGKKLVWYEALPEIELDAATPLSSPTEPDAAPGVSIDTTALRKDTTEKAAETQ